MKGLPHILFRRTFFFVSNERGFVLITTLMVMASLAALGIWGVRASLIDSKITTNYQNSSLAFYAAEAGLERAKNYLTGSDFSTELQNACGQDSVLVNSGQINNFPADDIPLYSHQSIGSNSYSVYLTNDPADGVTSTVDTNDRVTITSFGYGPGNSLSVVQGIVEKFSIPFSPSSHQ